LVITGHHVVAASIVLFNTRYSEVERLVDGLLRQGVARVFIVDNSPLRFDTVGASSLPQAVEMIRVDRNLGYGRAHNLAIRKSTPQFKYHIVCNPDIGLTPSVIETLVEYMDSHEDVGLCMPRLVGTDGLMQYCCRRSPVLWDYVSQIVFPKTLGADRRELLEMRDHDYGQNMEVNCLSGCFMFFRTSVLNVLGGFDPQFFMYFEDFDLSMRAGRIARNIYLPVTHVVHERRSDHKRSWRLRFAFAFSAMRYFGKWGVFRTRLK
jgi:GT2 family glycosyltransferase